MRKLQKKRHKLTADSELMPNVESYNRNLKTYTFRGGSFKITSSHFSAFMLYYAKVK